MVPTETDICIVGGGVSGLIVARDAASCGYRCVVVEQESAIGGVWARNSYPGLQLHAISACYRSISVAPSWHSRGDPLYRPTGAEVLDYVHHLANHERVSVCTSTAYAGHEPIHCDTSGTVRYRVLLRRHCDADTASNSNNNSPAGEEAAPQLVARVVVFATGIAAGSPISGEPLMPIDPNLVTNGALVVHSSALAQHAAALARASRVIVVGSSKAAIDVLCGLCRDNDKNDANAGGDERIVWAHRGHVTFFLREHIEGWLISGWLPCRLLRYVLYRVTYLLLAWQWFLTIDFLLRLTGIGMRVGAPSAKGVPVRGGTESRAVLRMLRDRCVPGQVLLAKSSGQAGGETVRVNEGGAVELNISDGSRIHVGPEDAVIFCTGQRQSACAETTSSHSPPVDTTMATVDETDDGVVRRRNIGGAIHQKTCDSTQRATDMTDALVSAPNASEGASSNDPLISAPSTHDVMSVQTAAALRSCHNKDGIFTILPYGQTAPTSAMIVAAWVVARLDGGAVRTAHSTGEVAESCTRIAQRMDEMAQRSTWALTMGYFGLIMSTLQDRVAPGFIGDMTFDHRWQQTWYGKDLEVREAILPLLALR